MTKTIFKISAILMLLSFWSCDNFLDVNHDPNVLEEVPNSQVLLPTAQVNLASNLMGWDLGFEGAFWSQYWTQEHNHSQFKFLCDYSPAKNGNTYNNLTSGVLFDLQKIGKKAKEKEQFDLAYIAEALEIYTWQMVVDIWGNVPYNEFGKGGEGLLEPKYNTGEEIYADLNKRIDILVKDTTTFDEHLFEPKYDFIFSGDMDKWRSFAKSLKLKLMLRISETSKYNNGELLTFIEANEGNFLTENAQISGSIWKDGEEGKRHPMREFQAGGAKYISQNTIACKTFFDYLNVNGDPRLESLFINSGGKAAFFGDYTSLEDTDQDGTTDKDEDYAFSSFAVKDDASDKDEKLNKFLDIVIMSTWEVDFYIAEVFKRAGNNEQAKNFYNEGINSSLAKHEIEDFYPDSTYCKWDDEKGLEQIAMQKWVAYANFQHFESFLERNRLKIPKVWKKDIQIDRQGAFEEYTEHIGEFTISVEGKGTLSGKLPASICYPDFVLARNANSPEQKTNISERIWWDQKPTISVE